VISETFSTPVANITKPLEGGTFADDIDLVFEGTFSYDTNDPALPLTFVWISDALGDIGNGSARFSRTMPVGNHIVTLIVSNGHEQGQTEVAFTIVPGSEPDGGDGGTDGGDGGNDGNSGNSGVELPISRTGLYFALAVVLVAIIGLMFVLRGSGEDEVHPSEPSHTPAGAGGFTQYADEAYGPMYTEFEQSDDRVL